MKITVAICTIGRDSLLHTLRSLERQTVAPDEVLIINQGPADLADRITSSLPIRMIRQEVRGLSRARNGVLESFAGDWVIWTDDDQEVAVDWVETLHALIQHFPQADFFGGPYFPPLSFDPEKEHMDRLYVLGDVLLNLETYLRPEIQHPFIHHDVWGGNYALSRRLVERVGRYDVHLGRGSKVFEGGEDTDYNLRMISRGFVGILTARLIIHHTFGARPKSPSLFDDNVESAAVLYWKATHPNTQIEPALVDRLRPFGRKKGALATLTRGMLFPEHYRARTVFERTLKRLDQEFDLQDGCLVRKNAS